jgi:hypothetical protein
MPGWAYFVGDSEFFIKPRSHQTGSSYPRSSSTPSARGGISAWPTLSLPFLFSRGWSGNWRRPGGLSPLWGTQSWFASLQALVMDNILRPLTSAVLVIFLATGDPPPILDRLPLVAWTISAGVGASTSSQSDLSILSRQGGEFHRGAP